MTQMEHVGLSWGVGGGDRIDHCGDHDYAGASLETIDADLELYFGEVARNHAAIATPTTLDAVGVGHGRPLGATLIKIIHEYTLHSGQTHMLRFFALGEIIR